MQKSETTPATRPFPHRFTMTPHRWIEYAAVRFIAFIFAILPLDIASACGGAIARTLGPMTGLHRRARRHVWRAFPHLTKPEVDRTIIGMWDNLGRTFAEYPHLKTIMTGRISIDNRAGISHESLAAGPALFIAGHFANWEIAGPALYHFMQTRLHLVYRAANNRAADDLLARYRSLHGLLPIIPKSRGGMRDIIKMMIDGQKVGILIDQKYNEGVMAPFFGIPAKSSDAYVQLGQRFKCPVYPAQIIRTHGAHFKIVVYPSLSLFEADGTPRDTQDVILDAHHMIEDWIRQHPSDWLWIHNRWPKDIET